MSISEDDRLYWHSSQEGPCFKGQQIAAIGSCALQAGQDSFSAGSAGPAAAACCCCVASRTGAQAALPQQATQVEVQVLAVLE